jgi:hypothetical protein
MIILVMIFIVTIMIIMVIMCRTSPRSKARHGGHRSASQERSQMSTSWAGHPGTQGALHYQVRSDHHRHLKIIMIIMTLQAQLESEAKRRLPPGSMSQSMAMPPPSISNNSTLRRAAGQVVRAPQVIIIIVMIIVIT